MLRFDALRFNGLINVEQEFAQEGGHLELAAVDDIHDILDGQAGLRDVGGQHDLARAVWRPLKDAALLLGGHAGVQRQHQQSPLPVRPGRRQPLIHRCDLPQTCDQYCRVQVHISGLHILGLHISIQRSTPWEESRIELDAVSRSYIDVISPRPADSIAGFRVAFQDHLSRFTYVYLKLYTLGKK